MNIGIFNPTLHVIGGGEYATIIMMSTLKKRGHRVIVLSKNKISQVKTLNFYGRKAIADFQIVPPLLNSMKWYPTSPKSVYMNALQMCVLRLNCEILIDVFSGVTLPWADITYLQMLGKDFSIKRKRELFLLPYINLLKSTNRESKILIACSKFVAQREENKGIRCGVLYPPVDVDFFQPKPEQLDYPRKTLVITVSRLHKEKKLENVPKIAKLVDKHISFLIVGSVQHYDALYSIQKAIRELNVSDRVKIMTNVPREMLRKLLLSSRVYLHTKEYEPFGITIAEAMSAGCTPIVHDSGGPKEFVPENLRYKTIEEAAAKIERAVDQWSEKRMREIISGAKKFREEEFSRGFLNTLDQAIEAKSKN